MTQALTTVSVYGRSDARVQWLRAGKPACHGFAVAENWFFDYGNASTATPTPPTIIARASMPQSRVYGRIVGRTPTVVELTTSQTSITGTLPGDMTSGDMVVAVFSMNAPTTDFTPPNPAIWTEFVAPTTTGGTRMIAAYYAFDPAAAPVGTVVTGARHSVICQAYGNVDPATPFDVTTAVTTVIASSITLNGVTTVTNDAHIIMGLVSDTTSRSYSAAPAGVFKVAEYSANGVGPSVMMADQIQPVLGDTGTYAWSLVPPNAIGIVGFVAALRPVAGPSPATINATTVEAFALVKPSGPAPYLAKQLEDSPTAHWRLNEETGTTADDNAGSRNGTYVNVDTISMGSASLTPDMANSSVLFNNSALRYVEVPNDAVFTAGSFSIEAVVESNGWNGNNRIVQNGTDTSWQLMYNGTELEFVVFNRAAARWAWAGDLVRHHVVGTYDAPAGRAELYVDGVMVAFENGGNTGSPQTTTEVLRIAQKPTGTTPSDGFNGYIDDVAFYSSALSATRIRAHASALDIVNPSTIAAPATVNTPTVDISTFTDATVNATTVARTATVNAPVTSIGYTVAGTVVARTATVGTATITAGVSVTVGAATVSRTAVVGSPTTSSDTTVASTTIARTATVGAPTTTAGTGVTVSPTVVARTAITGTAAVGFGYTVTGSVSRTASVGSPAVDAGHTVSPATVARTASTGVPAVGFGYTVSPSTIARTAAVGAPLITAGGSSTVNPGTIAGVAVVQVPSSIVAGVGATVNATTVARASSSSATTISTGSTTSPTTVAISAQTNLATISTGSTVSPTTIVRTATVDAPSVSSGSGNTVNFTTISRVAAVAAVSSIIAGVGAFPAAATVVSTAAVNAPVISITQTASPATVGRNASTGSVVIAEGATVFPATIASTSTVNVVADVDDEKRVNASTVGSTSAVGTPTVQTGSTVSPSTVSRTATVNAASVSAGAADTAAPATVSRIAAVNAPSTGAGVSITATTIARAASTGTSTQSIAYTVSPTTIARIASVSAPSVHANVTHSGSTIARAATVVSPVVDAPMQPTPATIGRAASVNAVVVTVASSISIGTIARTAVVGLPDVIDGASAVAHPSVIARVASVLSPYVTATQNQYTYADATAIYFNAGLSMDVNRDLTHIYIGENPTTIVLTPHARVKTSTGGYRLDAGTPRVAQVMRFIEGGAGISPGAARTSDGYQESDTHLLLCEWDAAIEVNDTFVRDGKPYVVVGLMESNGYSIRAEVMRRA